MRGLTRSLGAIFVASALAVPTWAQTSTSIEVNNVFATPTTLLYAAKTTYKLSEFNSLGNVATSGSARYRGYIIVPAKITSTDGRLSVSVTYTNGNWAGYFFGAKVYSTDMELLASSEIADVMGDGTAAGGDKLPVTYSFTDTSKLTTDKEVLIFILGGLQEGKTLTDSNATGSTGKIDLTGASSLDISGSVSYIPGRSKTLSISSTPTTWTDYYFPVKVNSDATTVEMTYTYSTGAQRVDISRVDAISLSTAVPQVVDSDVHNGSTGNSNSLNTYTLDGLTPGSTVVLRMRAKSPASGDHTGSISTLTGATVLGAISDIAPWSNPTVTPVYSAAAGNTLTVTGTITGDVPLTIGAEGQTGTVTFAAGTLANYTGTISVGNATVAFEAGSIHPTVLVTSEAAIVGWEPATVNEMLTGEVSLSGITFADGVTQCTVKRGETTKTVTAADLPNGTIASSANPTYTGNLWWWDYEFNGNGNNLGFEGTNLSWDSDRPFENSEYTDADSNNNRMLHLPARPWRNVDSGYPESFTAVMYCKAGSAANSILAAFGSSYKEGTEAIVLMTGENPAAGQMSLVLCHAKDSFDTLVNQEKMTVPNVSSSYHLYAFSCRVVGGKTVVDIYVDGDLVTSYEANSLITLGKGFQLAAEHGGSPNGVNRLADTDAATLDFLRVSNVALSSDVIKAMAAAYPYTSPNGRATRTVTASDTMWSEGTTWAQDTLQEDGTTATVNQAAPTAKTVVEVTASEAATLAMNLADAVTYENLVVKGEGSLTVTKAADTTATVTVTGATTISANTILPANVVKVGRVSVDADKTLIFDCSTLDGLQSNYVLTGYVEEAVASRIAVVNFPTDKAIFSGYTLVRDNTGSMVLQASGNKTLTATITGETDWSDILWTWDGNETPTALPEGVSVGNVVLTLSENGSVTGTAPVSITGTLTISGTGTLTIPSGSSVSAMALAENAVVTWTTAGTMDAAITLGAGSTLKLSPTSASTLNGVISGTGSVEVLSGTVKFAAANTYTGGTTVAQGATLEAGNNAALSTSGLIRGAGTIYAAGTILPGVTAERFASEASEALPAWSGRVKFAGSKGKLLIANYGPTVEFAGASGYLAPDTGLTSDQHIILSGDGWNSTNGSEFNTLAFTGKLSGAGKLKLSDNPSRGHLYKIAGDISEFTGTVEIVGNHCIFFAKDTEDNITIAAGTNQGNIVVNRPVTVNGNWTPGNGKIVVNTDASFTGGTNGGTLNGSVITANDADLVIGGGVITVAGTLGTVTDEVATFDRNISVANGATLKLTSTTTQKLEGTISGEGGLTLGDNAAVTYAPATTEGGTLTSALTLGASSTLTLVPTAELTLSKTISGSGALTIGDGINSSTVTLTGTTSHTGGTTVASKARFVVNAPFSEGADADTTATFAENHLVTVSEKAVLELKAGFGYFSTTGDGETLVSGKFRFGIGGAGGPFATKLLTVAENAELHYRCWGVATAERLLLAPTTLTLAGKIKRSEGQATYPTIQIGSSATLVAASTGAIENAEIALTFAANATLDVTNGPLTAGAVTCDGTVTVTLPSTAAAGKEILKCKNPSDIFGKLTATSMPTGLKFAANDEGTAVVLAAIVIPPVVEGEGSVPLSADSQAVLQAVAQNQGLTEVTAVSGSTTVNGTLKTLTAEAIDNALAVFGDSVVTAEDTTLKVDYDFGISEVYQEGSNIVVKAKVQKSDETAATISNGVTLTLVDGDDVTLEGCEKTLDAATQEVTFTIPVEEIAGKTFKVKATK